MALPVPEMRKRLEETAHSLKLEKLLNRSLFALSGGEKQKIACASADAIRPDIFVLDEPSSNLDIATIEDLIGVIRHWQSEKKTVIVAEHRLYYLVPYADRIFYMKHGSIVREFTGAEFQKLPPDELQGMGLRALDPFHLSPEAAPKLAAPQLHIKGFQFSYEKHGPLNVDIPDLTLPKGRSSASSETTARENLPSPGACAVWIKKRKVCLKWMGPPMTRSSAGISPIWSCRM